jgi:hypothetical protein
MQSDAGSASGCGALETLVHLLRMGILLYAVFQWVILGVS